MCSVFQYFLYAITAKVNNHLLTTQVITAPVKKAIPDRKTTQDTKTPSQGTNWVRNVSLAW
ncbi:protein of unknown function [Vibrio tapetis subsp. tapetis]|uniref:Uncharacterized protein n=1 Tax=Vibrio tapetis subsp. tapetis TaxID=1671868 RepID=A0A2N8ZB18_9VIBR|nr:protein of unknown function [Vibrio tapetis subsp. tapetis]